MAELNLEKVKEVLENSNKALESKVKEIVDQGKESTSEEVKNLNAKLEENKKQIENLEEQIRLSASAMVPGFEKKEAKQFSWTKFFQAAYRMNYAGADGHNDPWKDAGYEKEAVDAAMQQKAATADDGSSGGLLVPTVLSSEIIDLATAQMPIWDMNPMVLRGLRGDLEIPNIASRQTSYWVGENEKPTASDVAFGSKKLSPKEAAAFSKQSIKLLYQSSGVSDQVIKRELSRSLALKMHEGLTRGTGSDKQPLGIMNASGMTTSTVGTAGVLATNGARFRIDDAAIMQEDLDSADELAMGSFGYLMHPIVYHGLKRERAIQYSGQSEDTAMPMLPMNILMTQALLEEQLGYKVRKTSQVSKTETCGTSSTCSSVVFGNWEFFWIGMFGDLSFNVSGQAGDGSTGSAFLDRQVYLLASQMLDCCLVRPTAFTKVTGAETTKSAW